MVVRLSRFRREIALLLLAGWLAVPIFLQAAVPNTFTYQGSLKQNGVPVNGDHAMEFRLTNASGSQVYWTSGVQTIAIREGLYRAELSPTTINWATADPHIEIKLAGSTLLPRERLSSAVYALMARELDAGSTVRFGMGTSTTPSVSFANDTSLGFYRRLPGSIGIAVSSTTVADIQAGGMRLTGAGMHLQVIGAGAQVQANPGTAGRPGYSFSGANSDGMFKVGTSLAFATGGIERLDIDAGGNTLPASDNRYSSGRSDARWKEIWSANGVILTSSSKRKRDIREIAVQKGKGSLRSVDATSINSSFKRVEVRGSTQSVVAVPGMQQPLQAPRGIVFKWKDREGRADDGDVIGFMGDDLPVSAHALRADGTRDPENYYLSSVVGILSAHIRDLEDRIALLESKSDQGPR